MCWLKWKHAVISLCINLVSCEQSCMLPLTWWVPLGNWHFSGCLKHGCASRQALPFGTSVLEVRQRTGTHLLIIKITYSVCFAMPRTHLFPWDKTYQKVTIFKCETRADDGRCFLQRPQASLAVTMGLHTEKGGKWSHCVAEEHESSPILGKSQEDKGDLKQKGVSSDSVSASKRNARKSKTKARKFCSFSFVLKAFRELWGLPKVRYFWPLPCIPGNFLAHLISVVDGAETSGIS